jgi:cytochrome d ubiquinol oxidase subunit II
LRALAAGGVFVALAVIALILTPSGAPWIWQSFTNEPDAIAIPIVIVLAVASGWAVLHRRYRLARVTAAAEVALLLVGWAIAQYPYLVVPDLKFDQSAASPATLRATLIIFSIGAIFLIPSLWFLYSVFKGQLPGEGTRADKAQP